VGGLPLPFYYIYADNVALPAGRAAINRYLLQQRVCCCGPMLEQTDGDELYTVTSTLLCILCGQCQKSDKHGRPHTGANGKMDEKLKSENMQIRAVFYVYVIF